MDDLKARAASADQERRTRLNKRLRQAFIAGAELDSQLGRGLTDEELERALRRYPGDMVGQRDRSPTAGDERLPHSTVARLNMARSQHVAYSGDRPGG